MLQKSSLLIAFALVGFMANAQQTNPEDLYKAMDLNSDGELTLTEYSAFIAQSWNMGEEQPSESAGSSIITEFKKFDENEDGIVTVEEFVANYE